VSSCPCHIHLHTHSMRTHGLCSRNRPSCLCRSSTCNKAHARTHTSMHGLRSCALARVPAVAAAHALFSRTPCALACVCLCACSGSSWIRPRTFWGLHLTTRCSQKFLRCRASWCSRCGTRVLCLCQCLLCLCAGRACCASSN